MKNNKKMKGACGKPTCGVACGKPTCPHCLGVAK
jgi:hypothetical protein